MEHHGSSLCVAVVQPPPHDGLIEKSSINSFTPNKSKVETWRSGHAGGPLEFSCCTFGSFGSGTPPITGALGVNDICPACLKTLS